VSAAELDPAFAEDVADFFVDHAFRKTKARDLRADHAAREPVGFEDRYAVAERREVASDGERCGPRADARDALAVLLLRRLRQVRANVVLVVGSNTLEAADRHRLRPFALVLLDAAATARRLARSIARASEDPRKHIRFPIDHVGVAVAPLRDEPDV